MSQILNKTNIRVSFALLSVAALSGGAYILYKKQQSGSQLVAQKKKHQQQVDDLGQNRYLSQTLAQRRWNQLVFGSVTYQLDILLKTGDTYEGLVRVEFQPKHADEDLFIDYRGTELLGLRINGKDVQIKWNKLFLILPKESLLPGQLNELQIRIRSKYQGDGTGLHSYTDVDGKQYLYSQGESYFQNRFFPCFDQPDIKGRLTFKIIAPKQWTVISNEDPTIKVDYNFQQHRNTIGSQPDEWVNSVFKDVSGQENTLWVFKQTPLLPSYLYCVVAGEYCAVKDDNPGKIPMTLYCRESLKEHLLKLKDFVFEVTKESMRFYEEFFGVQYQFSKYDSVFVAEFNWGAMENPGCVTFMDRYVFKEQQVATAYSNLANTIAHEMAHHWFGNYVTMKWWNDLWLNESYADFISHFCLQNLNIKSIPLTNIGVLFNTRKGWGYREDQMVTTHPIAGDVENTEKAENIFDGITYSKGASVMRQLLSIMGADAFGKACGDHFKKYQWGNATLNDLIGSLDVEFKKQNQKFTLQEWQQEWIQKAGLNEILAEWNPQDLSPNAVLKIHQSAAMPEFPTLRRHKIKVAFLREDGSITAQDAIILNQEITPITYDGSQKYSAVLLNYEDQSFVKILLDEVSLKFFQERLPSIQDVLTRQLVWRSFFDMVRDAKISSQEYIDILLTNIPHETSDEIVTTQMMCLSAALHSMTPRNFQKILSSQVFDFLVVALKQLKATKDPKDQNRLILFRDYLFSFTCDDKVINKLLAWQAGHDSDLQDVPLTNSSQWSIVRLIYESDSYNNLRQPLFDEQANRDKSDTLLKMQKVTQALSVSKADRKKLWDSFLDADNKESKKILGYSMSGFNNPRKLDESLDYQDKFFDVIIQVFTTRSTDIAKEFYHNLFPTTDDLALQNKVSITIFKIIIKRIIDTLNKTPQEQETLRLELSKSLDSLKRQVRQYECFGKRAKLAQQH